MKKALLAVAKFIVWNIAATFAVIGVSIINSEMGKLFGDTVKYCVSAPIAEEIMKATFSALGCPWGGYVLGALEFNQYVFSLGVAMELRVPQLLFHTATGIVYAVVCKFRNIKGLTQAAESRVFAGVLWAIILLHAISNSRGDILPIPHWVGGIWVGFIEKPVYYIVELSVYAIVAIAGILYLNYKKKGD